MTDITFDVRVGGKAFPVDRFEATYGVYGSVGNARLSTSLSALKARGVDLFAISSGGGVIEVSISARVGRAAATRIFGGEFVSAKWDVDNDQVSVNARSWAGVLVDQRRVLTKIGKAISGVLNPLVPGQVSSGGISNQNQTVSMIVSSIAEEFGFTPVLHLSGGNNPTIGTLYGSDDHVFMPAPQSLWSILNTLAKDTGYVVYDTPQKELVFGQPGAGGKAQTISYAITPAEGSVPSRRLTLSHQPRRNGTFRVMVISYDPAKAQTTIGRAAYVAPSLGGQNGLTAGLASGSAALTADQGFRKLKVGTSQIPLYTYHIDGLSQQQAENRAAAIASDIARREFQVEAMIDGLPSIFPSQKTKITGDILPQSFATTSYYCVGYTHAFQMPSGSIGHADRSGFTTHLKLLNIPTGAQ